MPTMNMIQALNDAHKVMMARDDDIVVFGEDIGYFGGVFRVTEGLQREFGSTRVFDAPISEGGIVSTAVGMAAYGLKPVIEIQFADYIYPGYDQILSEVAKIRYRTAAEWTVPMVIRTPYGGGIFGGQTHSQSPESLFTHIAGLKVVIPSKRSSNRSRRPAAAWSSTKRRAPAALAPSWSRSSRSVASTTSKPRSSGSRVGTLPTRTLTNGPISRVPSA